MPYIRSYIFVLILCLVFPEAQSQTEIHHWETIVMADDTWHYHLGSASIPADWKDPGFNDDSWSEGPGGIGYADGDDQTVISNTMSVYLRMDFEILDTSKIEMLILHADYDDAFVAYLNGVEVARSNIGTTGSVPAWDEASLSNHEAKMYNGGLPEEFQIKRQDLLNHLKEGNNSLAIQVHNRGSESSDLSAIFFLSAGLNDSQQFYRDTPDWFYETVLEEFLSSNLPLMFIDTQGQGISSSSRIVAHMGLMDYSSSGSRNFLSDTFNVYNGRITLKIRGSSSQMFQKKNYSFELQNDAGENFNTSLLGMPYENDWVLHGPYSDKALLRNVLAYHIGNTMVSYSPRTRWIELFINNDYRGIYVLTEKIKQDANRVNIAKLLPEDTAGDELTGGYIFQIDRDDPEPDDGWYSSYSSSIFFAYHDPGYDELVPEQKTYLKNYINQFEYDVKRASGPSDWLPYINVYSFADYFITTELCKHIDGWKLSFYMYKEKDSQGGRINFGPPWDFNLAFGNYDFGSLSPEPPGWSYPLAATSSMRPFWIIDFLKSDSIRNCIACTWERLRAGELQTNRLLEFIDENLDYIEEARIRNFERWPVIGTYVWPNYYVGATYQNEVDFLRDWVVERLNWMDANMVGTCLTTGTNAPGSLDSRIKLYPNPFTDRVQIELGTEIPSCKIEIFNSSGIRVRTEISEGQSVFEMDLGNLESGMYFVKITGKDQLYGFKKLIKK